MNVKLILLFLLLHVEFGLSFSHYDCLSRSPDYNKKNVEPILSSLKKKGYSVLSGYLYWITNMKKHGGSPSSAYGMWRFNLSSEMKPDPDAPMSMLFHPSDAILFTGCSAPISTYIGFENYAYAKYHTPSVSTGTATTTEAPSNGNNTNKTAKTLVFSSMNGAINQHFLNISSYDESNNPQAPFNSIYSVITTGDKVTYNDIYKEYVKNNIEETVNNIWIPNEYFKYIPYNFSIFNYSVYSFPGHIDTFMPVQRIINHFNQTDFEYYTTYKQLCYLITPSIDKIVKNEFKNITINSTIPREPFTQLFDRNTTSETQLSEFDLYQNWINLFINNTINYFTNEYNMTLVKKHELVNYNLGKHDYGWSCYDNNWNCQGDLRDEQYWGTHNGSNVVRKTPPWATDGTYYFPDDAFFILIGINHFNTNFTIFDNLIFYYDANQYLGLFEPIYMFTNEMYNNSCVKFVNNAYNVSGINITNNYFGNFTYDVLNKFYMTQIARPDYCFGNYDFNIPTMCPNFTAVDSKHKFALYTRNLMNPYTLTRPSVEQIIPDTMLHFKLGHTLSD